MRTILVAGFAGIFAFLFVAGLGYAADKNTYEIDIVIGDNCTVEKVAPRENDNIVAKKNDTVVWHVTNNCADAKMVTIDNFMMVPGGFYSSKKGEPIKMDKVKDPIPGKDERGAGTGVISGKVKAKLDDELLANGLDADEQLDLAFQYDVLIDGEPTVDVCVMEITPK